MSTEKTQSATSRASHCYRANEIKHAIESRSAVSPEVLTEAALREAGCWDRVCILPEPVNERASYLGDALVQMMTRFPKDDELRFVVGRLCQSLSYLINSASWREGQLHNFDLDEVKRKLGRLAR